MDNLELSVESLGATIHDFVCNEWDLGIIVIRSLGIKYAVMDETVNQCRMCNAECVTIGNVADYIYTRPVK